MASSMLSGLSALKRPSQQGTPAAEHIGNFPFAQPGVDASKLVTGVVPILALRNACEAVDAAFLFTQGGSDNELRRGLLEALLAAIQAAEREAL